MEQSLALPVHLSAISEGPILIYISIICLNTGMINWVQRVAFKFKSLVRVGGTAYERKLLKTNFLVFSFHPSI